MTRSKCINHPDRLGIGVCMRCESVICAECCTRVDGINHCQACLKELAVRPVRRAARRTAPLAVLVLGLGWLALFGLLWLMQGKMAP